MLHWKDFAVFIHLFNDIPSLVAGWKVKAGELVNKLQHNIPTHFSCNHRSKNYAVNWSMMFILPFHTSILYNYRVYCSVWGQTKQIPFFDKNSLFRIFSRAPVFKTRILIGTILCNTMWSSAFKKTSVINQGSIRMNTSKAESVTHKGFPPSSVITILQPLILLFAFIQAAKKIPERWLNSQGQEGVLILN